MRALGRDAVQILNGHALADDALHPAEADAELVLQQLTHAAQAAVAQMVDVIGGADAIGQAVQVVDGGQHIVNDDVLGNQLIAGILHGILQLFPAVLIQQILEHGEAHAARQCRFRRDRSPDKA